MKYSDLCEVYEGLNDTSSRLAKTEILSHLIKKISKEKKFEIVYLVQGVVFADYIEKEFGVSEQLCIKALVKASGRNKDDIVKKWKKLGDLGLVAQEVMKKKKQGTLFSSKLTVSKVFENLRKLPELVGKGTVDKKMGIVSELLTSASGIEAKYVIRTLLNDLRIGVGSGTIRDSIVWGLLDKEDPTHFDAVQTAYDRTTDFALVLEYATEGVKRLHKARVSPGHPLKVMLAMKADSIEDGFKKVGTPAVVEYKYDGFRMLINKQKNGTLRIFTRKMDEVTHQFPDVVEYVKNHVKAESFILDGEAVGFDAKTKKYTPFEAVSQRIRRKHNIDELVKKLPIEFNAFDLLYLNGKSLIDTEFSERTKAMRKLIKVKPFKINVAKQIITSDPKEAEKFYKASLKDKQEGIMIKNLTSVYKPGNRVGHMLKLKPSENELDLVITGAEYGKGKRAGVFSSFILSCQDEHANLLEIGKAATGLKEKKEEGLSFGEITDLIKPNITSEKGTVVQVKPKVVVTILYQNIQVSPTYNSGFGLRFPRIISLRPDRTVRDIAYLKEIQHDYQRHELKIRY